jgi:hypothetical protein
LSWRALTWITLKLLLAPIVGEREKVSAIIVGVMEDWQRRLVKNRFGKTALSALGKAKRIVNHVRVPGISTLKGNRDD